jgi:type IV secretory pathway VirB10-like protein
VEPPFPASASQSSGTPKRAPEVNLNSEHGQPFAVFEGTTIDTVLVDRLDGEFAGSFKVMVTNPVYSEDRQHVLIPEGTFILGDTQKVSSFGQKRVALTFHRMLMPDKYSVDLDQFKGLDQAGETGIKGKVNNHYLQIFGTSIALGVIAGAAEATTNSGYNQSGSDTYRQGIASSLSQSSANVCSTALSTSCLPTPSSRGTGSRSTSPRTCFCPHTRTTICRGCSDALIAHSLFRLRACGWLRLPLATPETVALPICKSRAA